MSTFNIGFTKLKLTKKWQTIFLFLTLIFVRNSFSQIEVIDKIFQTAKKETFATDKKSQEYVSDHFDFETMAKLILGKEEKKQPKTEVTWFTDKIREIITKTIFKEATNFLKKVKFEHEYVDKSKTKSSILTIVKKRGEESEVITKLENRKGVWKIVDLSIDDESWTENIRTQVNNSIKEKGWKGLKDALIKRSNELNAN